MVTSRVKTRFAPSHQSRESRRSPGALVQRVQVEIRLNFATAASEKMAFYNWPRVGRHTPSVEDQARGNRATSATLDRPTQGRRHGGDVSGSRTDDGGNEGKTHSEKRRYGDYDGVGGGDSDGGTGGGGDGWYGDDDSGRHKVTYGNGGARR